MADRILGILWHQALELSFRMLVLKVRGRQPHVMLQLRRVLLGRRLFRERLGQHEFGLERGVAGLDTPVEGGPHPADRGGQPFPWVSMMARPVLASHRRRFSSSVATILRLSLAALLPPQPQQGRLVVARNDPAGRPSRL
jgi:hypothetical protein